MPKHFRSKRTRALGPHKDRINKAKHYKYYNPDDVKQKTGDEDIPGSGNFYCTTCFRYFKSQEVQDQHEATKVHKKSLKRKRFDEDMDEKEANALREYKISRGQLMDDDDEPHRL